GNYIVRNASRIVVLSRFEERHLLPYGVPERRMSIIPNGIQVPAVQPGRIPHLVEQEYFLYLGRIEARKNLIFLMDAYARYWQRGGRAALVLVGPDERGYARRVRARAEELGVDSQVHLLP